MQKISIFVRFYVLAMVVCAAASLCAGEAEALPQLADTLPEGTIMFAGIQPWSQWSADFSKTSIARICNEPEVRTFLAGPFNQVSYLIKKTMEQDGPPKQGKAAETPNAFISSLNILSEFAPGPFSVMARYAPEDAQAKRPPAVAVLVGVTDEKNIEAARDLVASFLKVVLDKVKFDSIKVYDDNPAAQIIAVQLAQPGPSAPVIALSLYKGRLIVSSEVLLCKQLIDGLSGKLDKKLSATAAYKKCGLAGDEHLIAYMDIGGLKTALGAIEKPAADARNQLDDFFVLAGLNKSIAVAWSLKMRGPSFESRTAIFSDGERGGLLGTLAKEPLSDDALKICPKSTPLAAGFRMRPDRVMPFIRNAVKAVQGQKGLENLNAVEAQLNKDLGLELEREVRAVFGNEIVIASLAGMENAGPLGAVSAFAASLSVQDVKKAEELLEQVLKRVAARTDPNGNAANVLKEVEHEGKKLRYLLTPRIGGLLEVAPAFVITDNRLLAALDVPTLKRAMKTMKEGGSLAESEAFKAALAETGGKMGPMFSYVDWAYMYKTAFSFGTAALKLIAPTDVLKQIGIDLNLLPATETVSQHLFPGLSVARVGSNGIVLTSRSPLPSVEVLSPPLAAVAAAFASFRPLVAAEPAPVKDDAPAKAEKDEKKKKKEKKNDE